MAYFAKGRKIDLQNLARELSLTLSDNLTTAELKAEIQQSKGYDEDYTRELFLDLIQERKTKEHENEQEKKKKELQDFELEKLRLQLEMQRPVASSEVVQTQPPFQLNKLIPPFDPQQDNMVLYLGLFERQLKFLRVDKRNWVPYLIGVLPSDIAQLIAREPEEKSQDFDHIKEMLLQRFKLSAEKLRVLFATHKKAPTSSWKDFHFELRTYFEGWIEELNINDFDGLKKFWILDRLKARVPPTTKEHFLDTWCDWITPEELIEKLDAYDSLRTNKESQSNPDTNKNFHPKQRDSRQYYQKDTGQFASRNARFQTEQKYDQHLSGFPSHSRRESEISNQTWRDHNDRAQGRNSDVHRDYRESRVSDQNGRNHVFPDRVQYPAAIPRENKTENQVEERPMISCYGCGKLGVIKRKCPTCSPITRTDTAELSSMHFKSLSLTQTHQTLLKVTINGINGIACADTGASNTIAGEMLYKLLKEKGAKFETTVLNVTLADGTEKETEAHHTEVDIKIEGQIIKTKIFALPTAKDNRTLLGTDFLKKAGIVLNVPHHNWYFSDNPREKYPFVEDPFPKTSSSTADFLSIQLRKDESQHLTENQRAELNNLIEEYEDTFQTGGEPTPYIVHKIDYGDLRRQPAPEFTPGDHVYVTLHPTSNAAAGRSKKFMPRRDGPYVILSQISPSTFEVASLNNPQVPLGVYHVSTLRPYNQEIELPPRYPLRKRGRPRKQPQVAGPSPGRRRGQRGRM